MTGPLTARMKHALNVETETWTKSAMCSWAGVSVHYLDDLIEIKVLDGPDQGKLYSDDLARRVVTALKIRRKRLIDDTFERYLKIEQ